MESNKSIISDDSLVKDKSNNKYRLRLGATILGISGISAIIAGVITSHITKKRNREFLKKLSKEQKLQALFENPYSLAFRALAWGTVWAVGGTSLILFGIWKWCGFKDLEDLRMTMRTNVKRSLPTDERTEFENLSDLINYLNEISKKKKKAT